MIDPLSPRNPIDENPQGLHGVDGIDWRLRRPSLPRFKDIKYGSDSISATPPSPEPISSETMQQFKQLKNMPVDYQNLTYFPQVDYLLPNTIFNDQDIRGRSNADRARRLRRHSSAVSPTAAVRAQRSSKSGVWGAASGRYGRVTVAKVQVSTSHCVATGTIATKAREITAASHLLARLDGSSRPPYKKRQKLDQVQPPAEPAAVINFGGQNSGVAAGPTVKKFPAVPLQKSGAAGGSAARDIPAASYQHGKENQVPAANLKNVLQAAKSFVAKDTRDTPSSRPALDPYRYRA
jgi:hypothetical protein